MPPSREQKTTHRSAIARRRLKRRVDMCKVISFQQISSEEKDNNSYKNISDTDVDGSTFSFFRMQLVPSRSSLGPLAHPLTNRDPDGAPENVGPFPHPTAAKEDETEPHHDAERCETGRSIHSAPPTWSASK